MGVKPRFKSGEVLLLRSSIVIHFRPDSVPSGIIQYGSMLHEKALPTLGHQAVTKCCWLSRLLLPPLHMIQQYKLSRTVVGSYRRSLSGNGLLGGVHNRLVGTVWLVEIASLLAAGFGTPVATQGPVESASLSNVCHFRLCCLDSLYTVEASSLCTITGLL